MKKSVFGLLTLAMVVILSSCAKYPQVEVDAAKAAVESARVAGADVYLPEAFSGVLESLNAATVAVEEQKSKFFSNYDEVKIKLAEISGTATQMVADTETRKAELKAEALALIDSLNVLVAENTELVAKAPKGKEGAAALEAIKADMGAVDGAIAEAAALVEAGNFIGAVDKAKSANDKALSINAELKAAIEKVGKKR
jgi:hypothetical protein